MQILFRFVRENPSSNGFKLEYLPWYQQFKISAWHSNVDQSKRLFNRVYCKDIEEGLTRLFPLKPNGEE